MKQGSSNTTAGNTGANSSTNDKPKNIILGKDGKPCRACNTLQDFLGSQPEKKRAMQPRSEKIQSECPPDVEELGRSTWTFLHSMAAYYPENPTAMEQIETAQFIRTFSKLYPCWSCAEDFRKFIAKPENAPRVSSREALSRWICGAHNEVNRKLGKQEFNCNLWKKRWLENDEC
ncbi:hypothetical protein CANCADRAFT_57300 [Tortispora caseinolytica NRRL Y-17796]|uniref:Sulfhydryl oxidase n=1 Tax=Tortispora caseinolytica NRRL Y-17796 TaxID=767744 RepID=A0A1E4TGQ3_9ASCO|nr:hypothetical protein CANCADRAFT_57300 [Tortispora caseinolytica NRRL Y-17796]